MLCENTQEDYIQNMVSVMCDLNLHSKLAKGQKVTKWETNPHD